jgi:hypothetical protein
VFAVLLGNDRIVHQKHAQSKHITSIVKHHVCVKYLRVYCNVP